MINIVMSEIENLNLDCVICKEHFFFPILTPCGHHFCKDCVLSWININESPSCPICKTKFPYYFVSDYIKDCQHDYFMDQLVRMKCQIDCPYKPNGCHCRILPKELNNHISKCEYKKVKCINSIFGCKELIIRKELLLHKSICNYTPCNGEKYGCKEVGTIEEIISHCKECVYYKIGTSVEKRIIEKLEKMLDIKLDEIKKLPRLAPLPQHPQHPQLPTLPQLPRVPMLPLSLLRGRRTQNLVRNELLNIQESDFNEDDNINNILESNESESIVTSPGEQSNRDVIHLTPENIQMRFFSNQIRNTLLTSQNTSNINTNNNNNVISLNVSTPRLQELSREMLSLLNTELRNRYN